MPGAHKIGAAISGPRNAGEKIEKIIGREAFSDLLASSVKGKENPPKKQGFFPLLRTPKIPGKEGENSQKNQ